MFGDRGKQGGHPRTSHHVLVAGPFWTDAITVGGSRGGCTDSGGLAVLHLQLFRVEIQYGSG